jgi:two-component system invasion response regulator UvrY
MSCVLIIDDHPIMLQGLRQLFEDAGINQIDQAQSLTEGFRFYRRRKPDVIIVDLTMRTGLGGLSFIRRLRLHDQQTPILVLTMQSDPVISQK